MWRSARFLLLFGLLAVGLATGGKLKSPAAPATVPAYFATPFQNESQCIVAAVATDLAEQMSYAASHHLPGEISISATFPDGFVRTTVMKGIMRHKTMVHYPLAVAALAAGLGFNVLAAHPRGQVDFGKFSPPGNGGQFVEVQINSNLLSLAAQLLEKQQPDAAKLLRSVQLVHVNVVGLTDENRAEVTKRVRQIRDDLAPQGWEQNVKVQEKDGQDVVIYTKTRGGEALAGLVITVIEPKEQAVLVNIVGDIRPEQVAALGDKLNIKPLKDIGAALQEAAPKK